MILLMPGYCSASLKIEIYCKLNVKAAQIFQNNLVSFPLLLIIIVYVLTKETLIMTVMQPEIDKLKEDFNEITNSTAEENPIDFYAYLHLLEINRIEQLLSYIELNSTVSHQPSWAEIKNHLDEISDAEIRDGSLA
jgi:hypothetical protein